MSSKPFCRSRKLRTQSHESLLEQLDEGYWAADFNAAGAELARLPPQFDQATVEAALIGERSGQSLHACPVTQRCSQVVSCEGVRVPGVNCVLCWCA